MSPGGGRLAGRAEALVLVFAGLGLVTRAATAGTPWRGAPTVPLAIAALCAVVALFVASRAGGATQATRWLDGWRLPLVLLFLWTLPDVYPRIRGDGSEYYVLARSLLFDHDLELANDFEGLGAPPVLSPRGEVTSRTPLGVGLLWSPSIVLAHVFVSAANLFGAGLPADGFGAAYQAAVTVTTYTCAVLAVLLIEALLRRYFSRPIALLVALALWFATPLHFYAVANPFMSHGCSAFAATLFLFLWLSGRQREDAAHWVRLGLVGGLMTLVRVQDGVLLALPLLDRAGERGLGAALRTLRHFAWGPVLAALLQSVVWARLWGLEFVREIGTQGPGFSFQLHLAEVLFSARHGILLWTPLWLVAVFGFFLWLGRDHRLGLLMGLGFAAALALNASMGDWWGSDGFGQRRFLGLSALFGLGLAEVVRALQARPLVPVAFLLALGAAWNHQFAAIYNREMVAGKDAPVTLDRLAPAQVELLYERLVAWHDRAPRGAWVVAYDNLKGVWLDEGRSLRGQLEIGSSNPDVPFLFAHGWGDPETDPDGVHFRRVRGKRAFLRVPVLTPGAFRVTVHARSEAGAPVPLSLDVNGLGVGTALATPDWSELAFLAPAKAFEPGLNLVLLEAELPPEGRTIRGAGLLAIRAMRFERLPAGVAP